MNYKRLEKIASSLMRQTREKRCYHFSFAVYKGRVLAVGSNIQKTHPINLINRKVSQRTGVDFSEYKHICSEFNVVNKIKNLTNVNFKKCTLVNIRYDRNMRLALAKPCMSCQSLLSFFEFKRVVWTNNQGEYCE
jgi:hypothetical protein